jgi:CheY-like chemotaxis protein
MAKKILIIDDEVEFTRLVKINLEATGNYDVVAENDSNKALDVAKEFQPNLILLDIIMPGLGGAELAFQLHNNKTTSKIPIVFLTAIATKEETKNTNVIGGFPFLAKPVSTKDLIACIEKHSI